MGRSALADRHSQAPERAQEARDDQHERHKGGGGLLRRTAVHRADRRTVESDHICAQRIIHHEHRARGHSDHRHTCRAHRSERTVQGGHTIPCLQGIAEYSRADIQGLERRAHRGSEQGNGGHGGIPRCFKREHEDSLPWDDLSGRERRYHHGHGIRQADGSRAVQRSIPEYGL